MKNTSQTANLLLKSMILGLIAILSIGCGNSREDFVLTNNNQVNPNGNLVFRFAQAQIANVPVGTTNIQFDLYDGVNGTGNLLETVIEPFATVITITDVSPNVQSVVITALGANNVPTGTITDGVVVTPGTTTEVDLSNATVADVLPQTLTLNPDPLIISDTGALPSGVLLQIFGDIGLTGRFINTVLFSNGASVDVPGSDVSYTNFSNDELLNVSADGLFSANFNGNTTLDASYSLNGTTVTDSSAVLVEYITFAWSQEGGGQQTTIEQGNDRGIFAIFLDPNGRVLELETFDASISPEITGVTIEPGKSGVRVLVESGVPVTTLINVNVSFTDPESGRSFSDTLTATVVANPVE